MLTKLLIATIVFLEILRVPNAQEKVKKWALSVFRRPIIEKYQVSRIKYQNLAEIDLDKISPLPTKRPKVKEPQTIAEGVIILDIPTAKILYQKNPDRKFPIASLTKIMTALVVLENYHLSDVIVVPKEATNVLPGATIYLREGERMTVSNLLYGLLLYSGNDAAYTLSSKMGQEKFVQEMNEKARKLGLLNTRYIDSSGLSEKNISTVKELAFLTAFTLRNPTFAKIVKTNETTITSVDGQIAHPLKNTNKLLREYSGTYAGKTGYTEEAGHCLIAAVERDGHQVLSVVLNSPSDQFKESMRLLDWTFGAYKW